MYVLKRICLMFSIAYLDIGTWLLIFGPFMKEPLYSYLADFERLMLIDFANRIWTFPFLKLPQIALRFAMCIIIKFDNMYRIPGRAIVCLLRARPAFTIHTRPLKCGSPTI